MANRDSYAQGTPSWVDLATTDLPGAKAFYSALFGWSFDEQPTDDAGQTYTMVTRGERSLAGMMQQPQEQVDLGLPPMWNTYISSSDLEATVAKVAEAGGSVMAPPFDVMDAGRMAVIVDPSGAVVCLWEPRSHPGCEIINEPGAFTWAELQTTDQATAAGFFGSVFGWDADVADMGPMGKMTIFKLAGRGVASGMDVPMPGVPSHWQVYFAVDDCDGACDTVTTNGGTVLMPAMDSPPGKMAVVADPAGAVFSIIALNEIPD